MPETHGTSEQNTSRKMTRRRFLGVSLAAAAGVALSACEPQFGQAPEHTEKKGVPVTEPTEITVQLAGPWEEAIGPPSTWDNKIKVSCFDAKLERIREPNGEPVILPISESMKVTVPKGTAVLVLDIAPEFGSKDWGKDWWRYWNTEPEPLGAQPNTVTLTITKYDKPLPPKRPAPTPHW